MFKVLGNIFKKGDRKEGNTPSGEVAVLVDVGRIWERRDVIEEKYEVRRVISSHTGVLYLLNHLRWDREIAMKTPDRRLYSGAEPSLRFKRECELWEDLAAHPNIAQLYYVRHIEDIPRLFIEFGECGNLADALTAGNFSDLPAALDVALQICHGMDFAHRKGLIHRDLKAENCLISGKGNIKITDFPLVRRAGVIPQEEVDPRLSKQFRVSDDRLRQLPGEALGTPYAMAPEQWVAPFSIPKEANIYSFGVILFELLCRRKPFEHDPKDRRSALLALKMMHLFEAPPDPRNIDRSIPEDLAAFVLSCLDKEPVRRPVSFADAAARLRKIFHALTGRESERRAVTAERLKADTLHNRALVQLDLAPREKEKAKKEEAVKLLKETLALQEGHPEARLNLELLSWEMGLDSRGAIANRLRDIAALDPSNAFAIRSFAWALVQEGEVKSTLSLLERLQKRVGDRSWLHNLKGILHLELDSPGQALTSFEKAVEIEGSRWEHLYNLGVCLTRQGKHREALDYMEKASAFSSDPRIAVGMAVVLGALSQIPEAEEVLVTSYSRDPGSAWLNYHMGALYGSMGTRVPGFDSHETDLKKAMHHFTEAFKKAPGFHRVRDAILEVSRRVNSKVDLPSIITRPPAEQEERELGTLWKARCHKVFHAHKESVMCVDISWNGRTIVSGGMDDVVCIWDPLTGQLTGLLRGHQDWIRSICISADGSLILSGSKDGTVRLWQLPDGRGLQIFKGHEGEIHSVAISMDSRYGASGGDDRKLYIWDLRGGDNVATLQGHRSHITSVALNFNGSRALTGSVDKTLRLWDVEAGTCLKTLRGHESEIHAAVLSTDGNLALSGCQDGSLRLWDLVTGDCLREFRGHEKTVQAVDISPDLRFGLSASWDGTLRLWDLGLGECICVMGGHEGPVMGAAILPDGRFGLSAGRDHSVRMWEWKEEALMLAIPPAALSPGDVTRVERQVQDEETFRNLVSQAQRALETGSAEQAYRFARDAQALPGRGRDKAVMDLLAAAAAGARRIKLRNAWAIATMAGHDDWVGALAVSPDGKWLASGSLDTTIRIWNPITGELLRTLQGHGREVSALAFFPDGKRLLSGSTDKSLRIWEVDTGICTVTLRGHEHDVTGVALFPEGDGAVSSSLDRTVRTWNFGTGENLKTMQGSDGVVYCVALSPDGRVAFAGGQDRTLRLWSTASGKAVREFKGHNAILRALAVSPSSPHAMTAGEDGSVCLWKIDTGEVAHQMTGHEGAAICAALFPEALHAATGGEDGTVRFWDLEKGEAAGSVSAHEGSMRSVLVVPGGRHIVTCGHDNAIRTWELDWEYEIG